MIAERLDPRANFSEDVVHAHELRFGGLQAAQRLFATKLQPPRAGGLLDDRAPIGRPERQDLVHQALSDDDEGVVGEVRAREQVLQIAEANARAVDEVLGLAVAEQTATDLDLGEVDRQPTRGVVEMEHRLGHRESFSRFASAEDELLVPLCAQHARVVLAKRPADRIGEIRLAAAVWPDDRRDPGRKFEMGLVHEALKPGHVETLQHRDQLQRVTRAVVAHARVTRSRRFAAAASSATRFDCPLPCATWPPASTWMMKSRRCSGPETSSVR